MGGLIAALYLRELGYEVDVYERSDVHLSGRGAGIVSHPALEEMLVCVGIADPRLLGFVTADRKFFSRDGSIEVQFRREQIQFSWNKLYKALLDRFGGARYHLCHDLTSTKRTGEGTEASFANGRTVKADLVVGADGIGSRIRQQHAPHVEASYAGYVGWRGVVDVRTLPAEVHEEIETTFVMATPDREQFVAYPVLAEHEGDLVKYYNFVWYRPAPADTVLPDLLTDETGFTHALGIPPPLIRQEVIEQTKRDADEILPRHLAAIVRATRQPFIQPIYDLASTRMLFARSVLVGDAAFVARPHVGAGVTKAASDARELATCLAGHADIDSALADYEAKRLAQGQRIVAQARRLGSALTGGPLIDPETLLNETAWLSFLEDK